MLTRTLEYLYGSCRLQLQSSSAPAFTSDSIAARSAFRESNTCLVSVLRLVSIWTTTNTLFASGQTDAAYEMPALTWERKNRPPPVPQRFRGR